MIDVKRSPRCHHSQKKYALFASLVWIGCSSLPTPAAASIFTWQGAGTGPETGNAWDLAANWSIEGTPGAEDTINILFSSPSTSEHALIITEGAQGGDVKISGFNNTDNRQVLVGGNATFQSLFLDFSTISSHQEIFDLNGKKITITGGSSLIPSLKTGRFEAARRPLIGSGEIEFTASDVYLSIGGRNPYELSFTTAGATIDFLNVAPHIEGALKVRSDQTFANVATIFLDGASLISLDEQRLDNFSGIFLESFRPGTGKGHTSRVAAGTYGGIIVNNDHGGLSFHSFTLDGDTALDSKTSREGVEGEYTVLLDRRNRNEGTAVLAVNGYTLTATGSETSTFRVGSLAPDETSAVNWLDLKSGEGGHSKVFIEGDLVIGYNGYLLAPDVADIILKGNFVSSSVKNTFFNALGLTLRMEGNGTVENPQFLEVLGADFGVGDAPKNNFAIGNLIIGSAEAPTYVSLTDQFSFSSDGDALYVGSLWVNEGSTLALNGLSLYVDGVLVNAGDTQYGPGMVVIPEARSVALLLVAGGLICLMRWRQPGLLSP